MGQDHVCAWQIGSERRECVSGIEVAVDIMKQKIHPEKAVRFRHQFDAPEGFGALEVLGVRRQIIEAMCMRSDVLIGSN
jgi:hypothetical protein